MKNKIKTCGKCKYFAWVDETVDISHCLMFGDYVSWENKACDFEKRAERLIWQLREFIESVATIEQINEFNRELKQ